MSCGCEKPKRASSWTDIPPFRQPTEMNPGENIDCYSRRAGNESGLEDDARDEPAKVIPEGWVGKIEQTSITSDGLGRVSQQFTVSSSNPPRNPTNWTATVDGNPFNIPGLNFSQSGLISGQIPQEESGKAFKVLVTASDAQGQIDSKEYTLVPKISTQEDDNLSLIIPYKSTNGQAPRVTSGFGERKHPITGKVKLHGGQDWAGGGRGEILAAADGEVTGVRNDANGYGQYIIVNHYGSSGKLLASTVYAHCSKLLVAVGQKVRQGQTIAIEGSTGASTGPHLHFEVRLGGTTKVDPAPFIKGFYSLQPPRRPDGILPPAQQINNGQAPSSPPLPAPTTDVERTSINREMVSARTSGCPPKIPNQQSPTTSAPSELPPQSGAKADVQQIIRQTLDADPSLSEEDKRAIEFMAKIESNYDPKAKNPTSSARGLFQMTDKTAAAYYSKIGEQPTIANRENPELATKAQIEFYKKEMLPAWNSYNASGKTSINGIPIQQTEHSTRYASLTKDEFIYGLIHHDGIGNAVKGRDMQGVDYYQRKIRES